jgi:hypothetical protein
MPGRALPPVPCGEVDLLLPTGMMVTLSATPSTTLRQLKDRLYQEAKQHPLFSLLKDQGFYNFLGKWWFWSLVAMYVFYRRHYTGWREGGIC